LYSAIVSKYKEKGRVYLGLVLMVLLACLIIAVVTLSLVPPTSKDELVHHLAVPRLYIEHGGIYEIPFMEYSYYPMNLELLYAIPLFFGNDIVPKFIHFTFALLTAWLIFYYLRSRTKPIYALFGAVFFLSIPIIIKLSITAYIDLGEIFFSFAALLLILEWMKSGFRLRFLIFSGIMCGLALGTKYSGLVTLALLTLFVPFLYSRYHEKKTFGFIKPIFYGAIFLIISLFIFSPWMIRNYHWKGNPIYPLYNQLFNPPKEVKKDSFPQTNMVNVNRRFFTYRSMVYKETGLQMAMLPVRVFFQGKDGDPQYFDGRLNPFLLLLPFFAFYRLRDEPEYIRREKKIILVFSALFFSFAFFSAVFRIRYISPIIPPLTVLSVFGLINLFKIIGRISPCAFRRACVALVVLIPCLAISLNADYIKRQFEYVDPMPYIAGKVSRDEYIAKYIPEYPAVKFINTNLDYHAKILFILIGNRGYYCEREYTHDMNILISSISRVQSPEDILKDLKRQGITHMLINYRLFEDWMHNNLLEQRQSVTQQFFSIYTESLFSMNGFGIVALK